LKFTLLKDDPSAQGETARLAARDGVIRTIPRPYASILTDDYYIEGPILGLDQSTDFAWVNGPGRLRQFAERGFLTDKGLRDRTRTLAKLTPEERKKEQDKQRPMVITWTESMRFDGRSRDPKGRPAGKGEFHGGVLVESEEAKLAADDLDTYTDKPVSLSPRNGGRKGGGLASNFMGFDPAVRAAGNPDDTPASSADAAGRPDEPKAELAYIEARNRKPWVDGKTGVHVVSIRRDDFSGEVVEKQFVETQVVTYDKRSGDYFLPGPGIVRIWKRQALDDKAKAAAGGRDAGPLAAFGGPLGGPGAPLNGDPKTRKPTVYGPVWELTKVQFKEMMKGRVGLDKDEDEPETRTADFYGAVKALNGRLEDLPAVNGSAPSFAMDRDLTFDTWKKGSKYLTSDMLRIVDVPPSKAEKAKGVQGRQYITAEDGNAQARDDQHNISGDILSYDTAKGQFWAFGKDGRLPSLAQQRGPGQSASNSRGSAIRYNRDGSAEIIDPSSITLYDGNGIRPAPAAPPGPPGPKPKPVRPGLRPPPRTSIERRDFRGT
jgi:hypothetical protein